MAKLGDALEAADKEFLGWLFREMRAQRVTSIKFKGLEIQLSQQAMPDPTKEELAAQAEYLKAMTTQTPPSGRDSMPPEMAGPLLAASMMAGEAPPPWLQPRGVPRGTVDPTDPERDIDDNELMGADLPQEQ